MKATSAGSTLATALQVPDGDMLIRDMLQAKLLAAVFAKGVARHDFVLKGGMALRTILGSHRYTKDIDFESPLTSSPAHLRSVIRGAIRVVLESQLLEDVTVTEPKQTETVQRWKINGRAPDGGSMIHLTVEISRRGTIPVGHVQTETYTPPAEYGMAPFLVDRYDMPALASTKVAALLSPNRAAPRDVYDLALLVEAKLEPPVELLADRGEAALQQDMKDLWAKLELMDWHAFETEVLPYLDRATQQAMNEDVYEAMRMRVGEAVEKWLQAAAAEARRRATP